MKKLFFLLAILSLSSHFTYSQNHSFGLSYSHIYSGGANDYAELAGASSYHIKNGAQYNLNYKYQLSKNLNLISGLQFQQIGMQSQNGSTTGELQTWDFQVDNLNIPILANLTFLKYLFVEGGTMLNFQINEEDPYGIDEQNGIGFSLGLGIQYDTGKFNVFLKSQAQMQTLIPFNREKYYDRLLANSLSVGIFYQL
ncbi:hypothetical protein ABWH96_02005 [Marivirga tractuosa]|uniref:hypothetical protein n=1 Tax=Marivirga tractuosa TaxID=1006 RepID=UPI0035CFE968